MKKEFTWEESLSPFAKILLSLSKEFGGFVNGHSHLDRTNTCLEKYLSGAGVDPFEAATYPLSVKQTLTGELHKGGAYSAEDLEERMTKELLRQSRFHVKSVTTLIDATPDVGLTAIDVALKVKEALRKKIELRVGTQPIFGFKLPERWEMFVEASKKVDVIGGLPEKDDSPLRIGYDEHMKRIIKLGIELCKEVHIHVDQGNDPREKGTETLIEAVRWLGSPVIKKHSGPTVWAVHAISPSCYDEKRRMKLYENMIKYNIGVICCPRAAISMRQLRPLVSPLHNSIAPILEMLKYGIPVRMGTDNIFDVFIPTGNGNILEELVMLADVVRYYNPKALAKLGCGQPLNDMDREQISRALSQDHEVFRGIDPLFLRM